MSARRSTGRTVQQTDLLARTLLVATPVNAARVLWTTRIANAQGDYVWVCPSYSK